MIVDAQIARKREDRLQRAIRRSVITRDSAARPQASFAEERGGLRAHATAHFAQARGERENF
jgi:hypothetical protein